MPPRSTRTGPNGGTCLQGSPDGMRGSPDSGAATDNPSTSAVGARHASPVSGDAPRRPPPRGHASPAFVSCDTPDPWKPPRNAALTRISVVYFALDQISAFCHASREAFLNIWKKHLQGRGRIGSRSARAARCPSTGRRAAPIHCDASPWPSLLNCRGLACLGLNGASSLAAGHRDSTSPP